VDGRHAAAGNGSGGALAHVIVGGVRRTMDRAAVLREFNDKGYVVFDRAVQPDVVSRMRQVFDEYFTPFSRQHPDRKRYLMHLPFREPLYHPSFLEHPQVLWIVEKVLGKDFLLGYFGSETAMPGADYMKAHFDLMFLTRMTFLNYPLEFVNKLAGTLGYVYGIQVSVPLVDSNADNAPFEIWPNTNRFSLKKPPSEVILMPAGSLIVRDIRNLHRGTPHHGDAVRPFLSLVDLRSWVPRWKAPEIPRDVYDRLPEKSRRMLRMASIGQPVPDPQAWATRPR
jgi:hypothetical protein